MDFNIAKKITKEISEKYKLIPIKEENGKIEALTCKEDKEKLDTYVNFLYNKEINSIVIEKDEFNIWESIIYAPYVSNLDELLIYKAIDKNASDIHFEPFDGYVNIRYRINGILSLAYRMKFDKYIYLISKIKLEGNMDIAEKRKPQDGKIIKKYNNKKYDLRVSSIPVIYGEKIVIRILYCNSFNYKLEELDFSNEQIELIRKIMFLENGLFLVNGPTGSGKSTTLYTILKEISEQNINITTIEDPVEISIKNVNQMNLNRNLGIDFSTGLKNILRQDPDVIMIGEIRDKDTAEMSIRASITGHKVYSTLHCKSPREVYLRLINMGVDSNLLIEALGGIISQRLIKILCDDCKVLDKVNKHRNFILFKKGGCKKCNYTGYVTRKLISSVYYLKNSNKKNIEEIYNDKNYLSNKDMKYKLEELLFKGEIPYEDYSNFLEGEDLNEL